MDTLLRTLYDYAFEHRMARCLEEEPSYHECGATTERQLRELRGLLDTEGARRLEDYVDDMELLHTLKLEAMFQAGLSVGLELSRL